MDTKRILEIIREARELRESVIEDMTLLSSAHLNYVMSEDPDTGKVLASFYWNSPKAKDIFQKMERVLDSIDEAEERQDRRAHV